MQTAQVRFDLDVLNARWATAMAFGDDDLAEFLMFERQRIVAEATDYDAYMKQAARMGYVRAQRLHRRRTARGRKFSGGRSSQQRRAPARRDPLPPSSLPLRFTCFQVHPRASL